MNPTPSGGGPDFLDWLERQRAGRAAAGLERVLRPRSPGESGPAVLDLAGNDYLGLSQDPRVVGAACAASRAWGAGAGASRLVSGTTALHADLERALADFCGQPAALVFSSGYLANLGAVTALVGRGDLVVCDAHAHASLLDACRLSRARVVTVDHLDVDATAEVLAGRREPRALVVTESVFSVLGDAAPLADLAAVCDSHGAVLLVDEAHALGVSGVRGRGLVHAAGLAAHPGVVVTATLSKALGSQGGVVLGHPAVRDHLINTARAFVYDTGLAPAAVGAALAALRIVEAEPGLVDALARAAVRLAAAVGAGTVAAAGPAGAATRPAGFPPGAVVSVPCAGPGEALAVAQRCAREGVAVGCFRPPSVPDRVSRIRLTARATLTPRHLDLAERVLAGAMRDCSGLSGR